MEEKLEQEKKEVEIFTSSNEYVLAFFTLGLPCIAIIIAIIFSIFQN